MIVFIVVSSISSNVTPSSLSSPSPQPSPSSSSPLPSCRAITTITIITVTTTIIYWKTSFGKKTFSAWASMLNMDLINKGWWYVCRLWDMVFSLSPVGFGVQGSNQLCQPRTHVILQQEYDLVILPFPCSHTASSSTSYRRTCFLPTWTLPFDEAATQYVYSWPGRVTVCQNHHAVGRSNNFWKGRLKSTVLEIKLGVGRRGGGGGLVKDICVPSYGFIVFVSKTADEEGWGGGLLPPTLNLPFVNRETKRRVNMKRQTTGIDVSHALLFIWNPDVNNL